MAKKAVTDKAARSEMWRKKRSKYATKEERGKSKRGGATKWKPGQSGSPATQFQPGHQKIGGRQPGIVRLIRRETKDGAEIVMRMLAIMRAQNGDEVLLSDRHLKQVSIRDIADATKWLKESAWGKAPLIVHVGEDSGGEDLDFGALTPDELRSFLALYDKAGGKRDEGDGEGESGAD